MGWPLMTTHCCCHLLLDDTQRVGLVSAAADTQGKPKFAAIGFEKDEVNSPD
jgi:hypothetical protein